MTLTEAPELTALIDLGYAWRHVGTQPPQPAPPEWHGDLWDKRIRDCYQAMIANGEIITVQRKVPSGYLIFAKLATGVDPCQAQRNAAARLDRSRVASEQVKARYVKRREASKAPPSPAVGQVWRDRAQGNQLRRIKLTHILAEGVRATVLIDHDGVVPNPPRSTALKFPSLRSGYSLVEGRSDA